MLTQRLVATGAGFDQPVRSFKDFQRLFFPDKKIQGSLRAAFNKALGDPRSYRANEYAYIGDAYLGVVALYLQLRPSPHDGLHLTHSVSNEMLKIAGTRLGFPVENLRVHEAGTVMEAVAQVALLAYRFDRALPFIENLLHEHLHYAPRSRTRKARESVYYLLGIELLKLWLRDRNVFQSYNKKHGGYIFAEIAFWQSLQNTRPGQPTVIQLHVRGGQLRLKFRGFDHDRNQLIALGRDFASKPQLENVFAQLDDRYGDHLEGIRRALTAKGQFTRNKRKHYPPHYMKLVKLVDRLNDVDLVEDHDFRPATHVQPQFRLRLVHNHTRRTLASVSTPYHLNDPETKHDFWRYRSYCARLILISDAVINGVRIRDLASLLSPFRNAAAT